MPTTERKAFLSKGLRKIVTPLVSGIVVALIGLVKVGLISCFAQNNGLIQLTGVASRHVGYYIAALLVLLGLFPIVGDLFSTMLDPVLGGATLLMFGMVAAAGIRIIASQPIGRKETLVLAIAFGLGLGVELCPQVQINGNGVSVNGEVHYSLDGQSHCAGRFLER